LILLIKSKNYDEVSRNIMMRFKEYTQYKK